MFFEQIGVIFRKIIGIFKLFKVQCDGWNSMEIGRLVSLLAPGGRGRGEADT